MVYIFIIYNLKLHTKEKISIRLWNDSEKIIFRNKYLSQVRISEIK